MSEADENWILIVDDEPLITKTLEGLVQEDGAQFFQAVFLLVEWRG